MQQANIKCDLSGEQVKGTDLKPGDVFSHDSTPENFWIVLSPRGDCYCFQTHDKGTVNSSTANYTLHKDAVFIPGMPIDLKETK